MSPLIMDAYGRRASFPDNLTSELPPQPYLIDGNAAETTYLCFFDTEERAIWRISRNNGVTAIEIAFGKWEERTGLSYQPRNSMLRKENGE